MRSGGGSSPVPPPSLWTPLECGFPLRIFTFVPAFFTLLTILEMFYYHCMWTYFFLGLHNFVFIGLQFISSFFF